MARLGVGWLLAGSTAMASLALTGYSVSPGLSLMIGCAFLLGLGSGAIDSGLNAYAAGAFGSRHMNWMHAFFGLGVALGPLIITTVMGVHLPWRWGYGIVASAQAVLALAFVLTVRAWGDRQPAPRDGEPQHAPPKRSARSRYAKLSGCRPSGSARWRSPPTSR
jgi:MFS family permease